MLTSAFLQKQARKSAFWHGATIYDRCLQSGLQTAANPSAYLNSAHSGSNHAGPTHTNISSEQANDEIYRLATHATSPTDGAYPYQPDFLYRYGYEFLGMAYCTYVHRVVEKIKQFEIDHVLFVAREGYLFQKIYDLLSKQIQIDQRATGYQPNGKTVTTHYAYLSESSTFLASVAHLSTRELVMTADELGRSTLWRTFDSLGIPPDEFEMLAEMYGVDMRSHIDDYWNHQPLLSFLSDSTVQSKVKAYQQQARAMLSQYLTQCNFFGEQRRVGLVALGWEGTIQNNLSRTFSQRSDFPVLHGLYFCRRERQDFLKYANAFSHGLIYESRNRDIHAESVNVFPQIFEYGAIAPHAATKAYVPTSHTLEAGVRPVFESDHTSSRQAEIERSGAIAILQRGILDFAQQYARQWQVSPFNAEQNLPFVHGLISRHLAFPTYKEAHQILSQLEHKNNVRGSFWQSIKQKKISEAIGQINVAQWQLGKRRAISIPGLVHVYRIKQFLSL